MTNIGQFPTGQTPPQDFNFQSLNDPSVQAVLSQFGIASDSMADAISQLNSLATPPSGTPKKAIPKLASTPVLQAQNPQASTKVPTNDKPPTYAQSFNLSFNATLNTVATAKNLSKGEIKDLQFMMNNPGVPLDNAGEQTKLKGVLQQVLTDVQADLTSKNIAFDTDPKTGNIVLPPDLQEIYQNQMADAFNSNFDSELAKLHLSPEDSAKVTYAHYNPGTELPPNLQAALQKAEGAAIQDMRNAGLVVPEGWTPPTGASNFNGEISAQVSSAVEKAIQTLGQQKGLTDAQIQSTIYLFYNPGTNVGNTNLMSEALGQVMGQLGSQLGLPAGFVPPPNKAGYDAVLNGDFGMTFQGLIKSLPLTSEQLAQVRGAIADPASMDPQVKAIITTAWNEAVSQIQQKNGLPVAWAPTISLTAAGTPTPMGNLLAQIQEMAAGINMQITNLPDGDTKNSYINMMIYVGETLGLLKEIASKTQGISTQIGLKASKAQAQTQLDKIKKQQEMQAKLSEMEKKLGMSQAGGLAGMIVAIAVIAAIAIIFMCIPWLAGFGAALMACAMVMLAFTIAGAIVGQNPNTSPAVKTALMVCNIVAEVVAAVIMTVATLGTGSGVVGALFGSKAAEAGAEAAAASMEAVTTSVEQGLNAATTALESTAGGEATAAEGAAEAANVAQETVFQALKQAIQQFRQGVAQAWGDAPKAVQQAKTWAEIVGDLNGAASAGTRVAQSLIHREIVLQKGDMESYTVIMNEIAKLLKQMVNLMLGALPDLGDWMKEINQQQGSMISGASRSLNGLMRS